MTKTAEDYIHDLTDRSRNIRWFAVRSLIDTDDESAVEPLIKSLADEEMSIRWSAAEALGNIGDNRAIEPLVRALADEYQGVSAEARTALGKFGPRAVDSLILVIGKSNWKLRKRAVELLGEIGDERVVAPFYRVLKDRDKKVRESAKIALRKIEVRL